MGFYDSLFGLHQRLIDVKKRVVRSIPMRPEWRAYLERVQELTDDLQRLKEEQDAVSRKRDSLKRQFWAKVEADTECYDEMRLSEDATAIEVVEPVPAAPEKDDDDDE